MAIHNANWRIGVLRVKMAYSFTHAVALWHTYKGQLSEWVVTGAEQGTASLPLTVSRIIRSWLAFVQVSLWGGIAFDVAEHRVRPLLLTPLIVMGVFNAYIELPLFLRAVGVAGDARRRASRRAAALTRRAPVLLKSLPAAAPVTGTILDLTHKGRVVVHLLAPSRGTTRHRELTSETADSAVNGSDVSVGASDFGSRSTESWHAHSPSLAEPPHGQ
jgi:hypothetical protein